MNIVNLTNKSNAIAICVAATYLATFLVIYMIVEGWGWLPWLFASLFALPFSVLSGQLIAILHIPPYPIGRFVSITLNTIFLYFGVRIIFYIANRVIDKIKTNATNTNNCSAGLDCHGIYIFGKSNIIGICAAIAYLAMALIVSYAIKGKLSGFLLATLSFPFSGPSFFIGIFIDDSKREIIYLILNTIWWYFLARLIYSFAVKK